MKAELSSTNEKIELRSEGEPFRVFIIDRESPQAVVRGLSELTGTMPMIPPLGIRLSTKSLLLFTRQSRN